MQSVIRTTHWRTLTILALLFVLVQIIWWTPAAYPLTILGTIFHELGHAAVTIATGGSVHEIVIRPNGSGVAQVAGGVNWLIAPAGYLGATIISAVLLLTVRWMGFGRVVLYVLAAVLLIATVIWIRGPFGMFFTLLLAGAFAGVAWRAPDVVVRWLNPLVAVALLREALDDAWGLIPYTAFGQVNDAVILSRQTGIPSIVFSVVWTALAVAVAAFAVYVVTRRGAPAAVQVGPTPGPAQVGPAEAGEIPAPSGGDRRRLLAELEEQGLLGSDPRSRAG